MIVVILRRYLISERIQGALSAEGPEKAFSFTPCRVIDKWRLSLGTLKSVYSKQTYGFWPNLSPLLDWCYFGKAQTIQRSSQLISGVPSKESALCRLCRGEEG